ncbi:hypothetical protein [Mycolicibacterium fluoranthenivorans]|uniref:Uncharacterized protein n=1 Tax=Mycolicibacterium fluoranthenivorans TaxID=258505 RepID=A0A1G4X2N4_9MYCO|nr:hypothetical protein [Mycolicibacterium fluoranthenivorans]SCX34522.1 hypothetical protein SAMN02799620_06365 [Mycolicibacterium fluoranthenivorans]
MSATKTYRQCRLRLGTEETTGWIETRGAKVGAHVELFAGSSTFWEVVVEVFADVTLDHAQLREQQQLNRNSLPSVQGMSR